MSKECWVGPAYPVEPISRALGLVTHPLELAAHPPDDISIDPLQGGTQLRPIEVAVVGDPAADARVVHLGQFGQGAGRITWEMFHQIKQRQPILRPKLYLPYRELQALAML